jgi:hypothetical protein
VLKQRRHRTCYRCNEAIQVGDTVEAKRMNTGTKCYHGACYDRMHYYEQYVY